MENELREIEEKEIIIEEDVDESDPENKKYDESRIYYVYEHIRLDKMEVTYSYRSSIFKNTSDIIVRAKLRVVDKDVNEMRESLRNLRMKRLESQPIEYKNAGSVFKNPKGYFAGELIDKCGLKGYNVKDAYVSDLHAGFIINKGEATAKDVLELIAYIKKKVYKKFNKKIELEIEVLGED